LEVGALAVFSFQGRIAILSESFLAADIACLVKVFNMVVT
jgi:hypothetical protein